MFSATSEIVINRPIESVFDYISHLENDPLWCPEVKSVTASDANPPQVGKTYDMVARPIPKDQHGGYRITCFDEPTALDLDLWQDGNQGTTTYRLQTTPEGTHLAYATNVELAGIARVFAPMIGWLTTTRRGPRMLRNLKEILEAQPAGRGSVDKG